eukprot:5658168-Amphidinium_carterae.1
MKNKCMHDRVTRITYKQDMGTRSWEQVRIYIYIGLRVLARGPRVTTRWVLGSDRGLKLLGLSGQVL